LFVLGEMPVLHVTGKGASAAAGAACARGALVVLDDVADLPAGGDCRVIDLALLRKVGPLAIDAGEAGRLDLRPVRNGARLWNAPPADAAALAALAAPPQRTSP
jgi:hypothetical protein